MPKKVLETPSAPPAAGPYSPAVEANGFVFVSGQVAIHPDGADRPVSAAGQAEVVLGNIAAILGDAGLTLDDVAKSTVFLADMADFEAVNEVYARHFGDDPPARSTFQVGALPRGFLVEIEVIAAR